MPRRTLVVDLLGFTGTRGGTETYVKELLPRVASRLEGTEVVTLTGEAGVEAVRDLAPGALHVVPGVGAGRASWAWGTVARVPRAAARREADVLWCPANFGPVTGRTPTVVTVHDAIYHAVPGKGLARVTRTATAMLASLAARHATRVLTVSDAAARDIVTHLHVQPERITVVPNGSRPPATAAAPGGRERLGIPAGRRVVATIGNAMPHKNLASLVHAVGLLPADRRPAAVIVGSGVPEALAPLVATLGLHEDVILRDWVDAATLEDVFAVADVYACVSLLEGFGLPVLDAMHRGVAVLAHDIPVLREVGGDVAVFADARDPAAFGAALVTLLDDADRLAVLAARGPAHAEPYTWDKAADAVADVLATTLHEVS
ncbi:glycosyltransferase family 1 protein [Demequina capsici]|uniref:Glycosyltransferase family 1 protein n=1 Tax=Demequina capsici TaxID=3075620 RepID=A0AA96JB41_9MICO|nr:glycosyltransferase family 1 protein [Demequina sp. PMTSA13]WNM27643.1 glycosyltransferase family 1 protein [Demequina sp. PMTSA13]